MGQSQPSCPCVNGQDGRVCCVTPGKWPRLSELPLGACKAAGSPVAQGQQPSLCAHRGAMCRVQELAGGGPPPRPQAASARQPPPRPLAAQREPGAGFLRRLTGWKITCYPAAAACAAARAVFTVGERSLCYFRAGARAASPWGSGQDAQQPGLAGACLPLLPLLLSQRHRQGDLHGVGGAGGRGRAPSCSELRCSWLRLLPQLGDEAAPGPGPRPRLWRGRLRGCLEGAPQASPSWSLGCGPWADVPCTAHNTHVALEHTMHTLDGTHMHTLHGGHTCWHTPTHCAVHTCDETHTFCIVQHMMALTLTHLHSAHM